MIALDTLSIAAFDVYKADIMTLTNKLYLRQDIEDECELYEKKIARYFAAITYAKLIWQHIFKKEWTGAAYEYVKDTTIDWETDYDYEVIRKRLAYFNIDFDLILTAFGI